MSILNRVRSATTALGLEIRRRGDANRFQAMDVVLGRLRRQGYTPRVVLDVGANVGSWTEMAREHFPTADYHLVEPQPSLRAGLESVAGARGRVYGVALTGLGVEAVEMAGSGPGAYVSPDGDAETVRVPAATLDGLFAEALRAEDRALVKIDVEGHEMAVLSGAAAVLAAAEVAIVEVAFFKVNGWAERPLMTEVARAFEDAGFLLYDFAALTSRQKDKRLMMGDAVFVRASSPLAADVSFG